MEREYNKYKWVTLISFSLMYNVVYLGRFNVNYLMGDLSAELHFSEVQQNMISMSVFFSYAAGSFFNGYFADRFGGKKIILCGASISAILNICMAFQENWIIILCIWAANGFFQSMIWVGGIHILAQWWSQGERGKGVGIANFFSGMSHTMAYVIPLFLVSLWPDMNWRMNFILPMCLLLVLLFFFGAAGVERPEARGLLPYLERNTKCIAKERYFKKKMKKNEKPWLYFFQQKKFLWWCGIAMVSSICRYGLLSWIPRYYEMEGEGEILSESFSNLTFPIGMAFGTLIITWFAETKAIDNKGIVVTAMAAICGALVIVFPIIEDSNTVLVGIFFTGFALYGINGILWICAIDEGCRVFAGSTAGMLNAFAYFGAFIEGILSPILLEKMEDTLSIFIIMEALCVLLVVMGVVVSKKNTVVVPEVRE